MYLGLLLSVLHCEHTKRLHFLGVTHNLVLKHLNEEVKNCSILVSSSCLQSISLNHQSLQNTKMVRSLIGLASKSTQQHNQFDHEQPDLNSRCSTGTQTEIQGATPKYYQILQTTAAPSKTARKRQKRNNNKKEHQQLRKHQSPRSQKPETNLNNASDVALTSTSPSQSTYSSSDIEITTHHNLSPLSEHDASNIPRFFTNPHHTISLSDSQSFSAADVTEAERYLAAEQEKLWQRMKLCK